MADAGPYGITQFNAAGLLGAYQDVQANRIRLMLAQKQLQVLDKKQADDSAVQKAIAAYYGGGNASQAAPDASGSASTATAPSVPATASSTPTAAPRPSAADRERLFSSLMAINPETATNVMDAMSKMDKTQLEQSARTNLLLAQHATGYKMLPYAERKAAIAKDAGTLSQLGLTPDQINNFDPSDQNLNQIIAQSFDVERLAQFVQPKLVPVTQGGSVTAFNPDGTQQTVYESPTVQGPSGEPFVRPPAMSTMPRGVPQSAIDYLKQHPDLAPQFDQKYGAGSAAKIMGGAGGNASGGFQ